MIDSFEDIKEGFPSKLKKKDGEETAFWRGFLLTIKDLRKLSSELEAALERFDKKGAKEAEKEKKEAVLVLISILYKEEYKAPKVDTTPKPQKESRKDVLRNVEEEKEQKKVDDEAKEESDAQKEKEDEDLNSKVARPTASTTTLGNAVDCSKQADKETKENTDNLENVFTFDSNQIISNSNQIISKLEQELLLKDESIAELTESLQQSKTDFVILKKKQNKLVMLI